MKGKEYGPVKKYKCDVVKEVALGLRCVGPDWARTEICSPRKGWNCTEPSMSNAKKTD